MKVTYTLDDQEVKTEVSDGQVLRVPLDGINGYAVTGRGAKTMTSVASLTPTSSRMPQGCGKAVHSTNASSEMGRHRRSVDRRDRHDQHDLGDLGPQTLGIARAGQDRRLLRAPDSPSGRARHGNPH